MESEFPDDLPPARANQRGLRREIHQEDVTQEEEPAEEITYNKYSTRHSSRRGLRIDDNDDEEEESRQVYNTRRRGTGGRRPMILDDFDDDENDEEFKVEEPIPEKKPLNRFIRPTKSSKRELDNNLTMDIEPEKPQDNADTVKPTEEEHEEQPITHFRVRRSYRPEPLTNPINTEETTYPEDGHRNIRRIATLNERENTAFTRLVNLTPSDEIGKCARCSQDNARVKCETCSSLYHQRCAKYRGSLVATSILRRGFQCFECQHKKNKKDLIANIHISRNWASSETKQDSIYSPQPGDKVCFIFQAYEEFLAKYFANLDFENPEDIFSFEKIAPLCLENPEDIDSVKEISSLRFENVCEVVDVKYHFPVFNKKTRHSEINTLTCYVTLKIVNSATNAEETFKVWYFPVEGNDSLQFLIPKKKYDQGMAAFSKIQLNTAVELSHDGELGKFIIYEVRALETIIIKSLLL